MTATRTGPANAVDQKISVRDAINGYTLWPAYASFEEQRKGTLAPGMLADVVILTADILTKIPATAAGVVVATTIFDGKVVCEKPK